MQSTNGIQNNLIGKGEMAELTRAFNWSSNSVGTIREWPSHLKTTINIILNSKFPMFVWWGEDLIQFYNDEYRKILGDDGKHPVALGQKANECWGEIWHIIHPLIQKVLATGEAVWSEDQLVPIYRNGMLEDVYWTFCYSPLYRDTGEVDGIIVVCIETTEKIIATKKFEEMNEEVKSSLEQKVAERTIELEKINKELQSFAYIASHDLQEPLRKIQTYSDRILDKENENLSETGKEYFRRLQSSANRMQVLIMDLLEYSRTNNVDLKIEHTDLNSLIAEVTNEIKEVINSKHAVIEADKLCEAFVIPYQFRQVMQNLISNSLKFSKEGVPPVIKIHSEVKYGKDIPCDQLSSSLEYCHLCFSDNGIGFEPQYRFRIFEMFQRLNGRSEYEGTGIGLAIVNKIIENHKGVILAKSELGKGATFDIYIPQFEPKNKVQFSS
ncbi:MAG: ATP-binding protein [Ferruginibacter sp.]